MSNADTTRVLLTHVLDMLRHSPAVDRVESQLLLFNAGEFADLFAGPEFTVYPRLFLECPLRRPIPADQPVAAQILPAELELHPWTAHDYQAAGELIHACYIGHTDAEINDQYRTLHGSLRFLHNIVRFPAPRATFGGRLLLGPPRPRDRRTRRHGALLPRRSRCRAHHPALHRASLPRPQTRPRPAAPERGHTPPRGFRAITLTVTEANHPAVKLYAGFGFTLKHRFDAMSLNTKYRR